MDVRQSCCSWSNAKVGGALIQLLCRALPAIWLPPPAYALPMLAAMHAAPRLSLAGLPPRPQQTEWAAAKPMNCEEMLVEQVKRHGLQRQFTANQRQFTANQHRRCRR